MGCKPINKKVTSHISLGNVFRDVLYLSLDGILAAAAAADAVLCYLDLLYIFLFLWGC